MMTRRESLTDLVDRGIQMNREARNSYGLFGALLLVGGLVLALVGNEMWPIVVGVGTLFALVAVHAEHLRRKLAAARRSL